MEASVVVDVVVVVVRIFTRGSGRRSLGCSLARVSSLLAVVARQAALIFYFGSLDQRSLDACGTTG